MKNYPFAIGGLLALTIIVPLAVYFGSGSEDLANVSWLVIWIAVLVVFKECGR